MTQPTDRDRERVARFLARDFREEGDPHDALLAEFAAVRAEGRAEALSPENIADLEANAYEAGARDMRERAARESAWGAWHTIERRIRSLPLSEPTEPTK